MARGNSNQSEYKTFFVKLKSKNLSEPVFEFVQALGEDKLGEVESYNLLSGNVVSIENTSNEYKGKTILGFRVHFVDPVAKERYIFSSSFTWMTRGIIDALLNLKEFDNVAVSVYAKSGTGDYAGTVFHNAYVTQNTVAQGWKHGNKVFKPMVIEMPKKKGDKVAEKDYFDLDTFLQKEIETHLAEPIADFAKSIGVVTISQPNTETVAHDDKDAHSDFTPGPPLVAEDDLPF